MSLNVPIVASYQATEELSFGLTLGVHYGMLTVDNNKYLLPNATFPGSYTPSTCQP